MSLDNIQQYNFVSSLDGLTSLDVDQLTVNGLNVDISNLVPYINATHEVNLGSQNIKTTHVASQPEDLVNLQVLIDSNIYNDSANALTYLNKITYDSQSINGNIDFQATQSSYQKDYLYQGQRFIGGSALTTSWDTDVIDGPSSSQNPLQFKHFQSDKKIIFRSDAKIYSEALIPSKALVCDLDGNIVSSGVDSIKIDYLDNVSSDIQTQLNNKVDISTLSDYALLVGNNTFTGNNQFQNGNTTTTGITSFKNNSACDIDKGYELNAAFQTSTFTRRLGRISFLRNGGGTDYSGYMGLDVSTDGALYKRMLTLHKDNGVSAGANKITTTYTAVNNEDVVNKGSLNTVLGSYLTSATATSTYATISTVNNKADTFYVDVQDGLRVLKTGDTMSGDLTVNGTVLAYTLNSNAWARFEDYREGMSPFNQPSASMGYYFGTHNNNDTSPYSDLLCLNGWSDGSGGNVNLISFNKGGKGIRQFQGTHGSKSAFSTFYDCVMTDENSSNVSMGGALIFPDIGDCRIYNGSADAYNPTSTANNLIIKSWWGIGFESYDGGVRIGLDTRTGGAYFGGNLGVKTTAPEGDLHVQLSGAVNDYWGKLVVKTTSFWGDGCASRSETAGTQYATMFPMMFLNPHVVSGDDGWCNIRMGRSGGIATGRWWEIANRSDGYFQIGVERSNQLSIHPNGAVNICGASPYAVPNGFMARGSLTIGSVDQNYGWGSGWTSSTAGLLLECADLTEIAVHDANHRVASLMAYAGGAGRNAIYLGRDMGWGGASEIFIPFYRAYYSAGIPFFYNTGGAFLGTPGGNTGYLYLGGQSLVNTNNSPVNTAGNGYWYINTPGVYTLTMTGHAPGGSAEYFISLNCHNTNDLNTNGVRQLVACGWASPQCVISWTGWLSTTDLISFGCFNNYMTTPTRLTLSIVLIQGT